MNVKGKRIGFGFTASHCTYDAVFPEIGKTCGLGRGGDSYRHLYGAKIPIPVSVRGRLGKENGGSHGKKSHRYHC